MENTIPRWRLWQIRARGIGVTKRCNVCVQLLLVVCLCVVSTMYGQTAVAPVGAGTIAEPYEITTWQNLYWISQNADSWDKHFVQTIDIDFADAEPAIETWDEGKGWTPIGNTTTRFSGNYNGQDYKIKGLYIDRTSTSGVGFLGVVRNATISHLVILNADIRGNEFVGIAIGQIIGESSTTRDNSLIVNAYVQGNVSAATRVGGFVGHIGESDANITNCHTHAHVVSTGTTFADAGGFVGSIYLHSGVVLLECSSSGTVTGSGRNLGGFNGYTTGTTFKRCFSTAHVSMNSTSSQGNVGGFIGGWNTLNQSALIEDCYALGNVTGGLNDSSTEWHRGVGGFIGTVRRKYDPYTKTIINSYAAGVVTQVGSGDIGGFFGRVSTSVETEIPTVTDCFGILKEQHKQAVQEITPPVAPPPR